MLAFLKIMEIYHGDMMDYYAKLQGAPYAEEHYHEVMFNDYADAWFEACKEVHHCRD